MQEYEAPASTRASRHGRQAREGTKEEHKPKKWSEDSAIAQRDMTRRERKDHDVAGGYSDHD